MTLLGKESFAGYIANSVTITNIANTASNRSEFAIRTTGGTSLCDGQWIVFPALDASDTPAHQRAYANALLALTTGLKVNIYNYYDETCSRASFIELTK